MTGGWPTCQRVGRDQLLVVVYACPPRFVVAP